MEMNFLPRGKVEFKDCRIIWKNFRGAAGEYNDEGQRSFTLVIPDMETAQRLQEDTNRYGVGWNVRIKAPMEEGMDPFITLKVKVRFNESGPNPDIYLESNGVKRMLNADTVECLDHIDIQSVDLRIVPYDTERRGEHYRTAYLDAIYVVQQVDDFRARFDSDREPLPFD